MTTRHLKPIASGLLGLFVVACLWFFFAPTPLGGSTSYVSTDGISMEPRFHTGDLAIVRSQSTYHVGEVVAYHNKMLGTVVLHRIVGMDGSRYIFKGDNNNFYDFEHPTRSQLIGALWIHLPGVGKRLKSLNSPILIGGLVAVAMLLFGGAAFQRRRRRRARGNRVGVEHQRHRLRPQSNEIAIRVLAAGAVPLAPLLVLAVISFNRPSSATRPVTIPYKQSGTFSYDAPAPSGPTYPNGGAVTGEPLFTHVVNDVDVHFAYSFESAVQHAIGGTAAMEVKLASTSGWKTTFPLGRPAAFHGDHGEASGRVDLASVLALLRHVELTTGVGGAYTLTVTPHIAVSGLLGGAKLHTELAPPLVFTLDELEMQPSIAANPGVVGAASLSKVSAFNPTNSGSLTASTHQSLFVTLAFLRISVASMRAIVLLLIALVVGLALAAIALWKPRRRSESEAIMARYSRMMVAVEHVWLEPGTAVVDVNDIEDLVRVSEQYERSILHERNSDDEAFWVCDESGHFRYTIGAAGSHKNGESVSATLEPQLREEDYLHTAYDPSEFETVYVPPAEVVAEQATTEQPQESFAVEASMEQSADEPAFEVPAPELEPVHAEAQPEPTHDDFAPDPAYTQTQYELDAAPEPAYADAQYQSAYAQAQYQPFTGEPAEELTYAQAQYQPRYVEEQSQTGYEMQQAPPVIEVPQREPVYEVPRPEPVYEVPRPEPAYEVPQSGSAYEVPQPEPVYEVAAVEPVYAQAQMEPAYTEPVYQQPQVDPAYTEPQPEPVYMEPAAYAAHAEPVEVAPAYVEPVADVAYAEPLYMEPVADASYAQVQVEPAYIEPVADAAYAQVQVEPAYIEPEAGPAYVEPQAEPAYMEPESEPVAEDQQSSEPLQTYTAEWAYTAEMEVGRNAAARRPSSPATSPYTATRPSQDWPN